MFLICPVDGESAPVLAADPVNAWYQIDERTWQADQGPLTLEISARIGGAFRWRFYAADSPDPNMAVTMDDADTMQEALIAAYDALVNWTNGGKEETWAAYREED